MGKPQAILMDKKLYWKHHLSIHFQNGLAPISNNGVGIGGHVFSDFDKMIDVIGESKYYVCPVMLEDSELEKIEDNIFCSKVCRIGVGDFCSVGKWKQDMKNIIDEKDN